MRRLPNAGYRCTETVLVVTDRLGGEARKAALEWAKFHDIDPMRVPIENTFIRDVENCRVLYQEFEFDDNDLIVIDYPDAVIRDRVSQGEAPPLPFPPELQRDTNGSES